MKRNAPDGRVLVFDFKKDSLLASLVDVSGDRPLLTRFLKVSGDPSALDEEKKLLFKALLPEHLHIRLHKAEEGGYWAKVVEIPCYSQGETFSELFDVLTKAIYAYYDVPERLISELGTYIPALSLRKRVSEKKPTQYTLDDILKKNPEQIRDLQRIS